MKTQVGTVFIDISGSVQQNYTYWKKVVDIVNDFRKRQGHLQFVVWNDKYMVVQEHDYRQFVSTRYGTGGTSTSNIAVAAFKLKVNEHICIITDGEVDAIEVAQCDHKLKKWPIDNVECHIINESPNLSVTCPFTRNNSSKVYTHVPTYVYSDNYIFNSQYLQRNVTYECVTSCVVNNNREDFAVLDTIEDISWDTLVQKFDTIKEMLRSLNMGTSGNETIKGKLIKAKKRIINEFASRQPKSDNSTIIRELLHSSNIQAAIDQATNITQSYFMSDPSEVNQKIDQLIGLCGNQTSSFSLGEIASNSVKRADTVQYVQYSQPQLLDYEFVCPVLMDDDCPCILIDTNLTSIMYDLPKTETDFILDCPLRLLLNGELVEKVRRCVSQVVGLKGVHKYEGKNPFNRNELLGVLPLGQCTNHIEACNYVLAKLFTNGKRVGNFDMWMAVVYFISQQLEYMKEHLPIIEDHLRWRYQQTSTYASLTGLVTLVTTKLSTDVAMWYIFGSYKYQFSAANDPIRFHLPHIQYLGKLVTMMFGDQSISKEAYQYIHQLRWMLKALTYCKQSQAHFKFIKKSAAACYQHHLCFTSPNPPQVVLLDGKARDSIQHVVSAQLGLMSQYTDKEAYNLLEQVDPGKSASDCVVACDKPLPQAQDVWKWNEKMHSNLSYVVPICYATFRPWTSYFDPVLNRQVTWLESAQAKYEYKDPVQSFSAMKYYQNYIIQNKRVPTQEAYINFCAEKLRFKSETLPWCMEDMYTAVMRSYKAVFKQAQAEGRTVEEIAKVLELSRSKQTRAVMEMNGNKFAGGLSL